jgi:hypothetical protein
MMTIDKAIKNLRAGKKDCGMIPDNEFTATFDLAIEALKRVRLQHAPGGVTTPRLLPGETEE